ncbi:hypothetical protein [Mesorhizobium dulcispinae]|uniref:hypothetical protein n=1 Tax=Mesorhizobium dulcispinae TaxID=3072316 RepID=UPI002A242BEB|nr:hypothetical protein [Mesorhizobium sp. VK23D]MDX8520729.1 hypothetical protein [Mesorhizobium sp. VK23D]
MGSRLLEVLARRKSWLDRLALGFLIFLATLIAGLMGGASAQEMEKVRAATFNAYLLSPMRTPSASSIDGVRDPLKWNFDGGRNRLNYEITMRKNTPLTAAH